MKIYEFEQHFYPFRLMACVGTDAIRGFFELDCEPLESNCPAMTACRVTKNAQDNVVLFRFRDVKAIKTINIVHECGHLGIDVFEYIDQPICGDSSESFCYLIGWAGCCCDWLKAHLSGEEEDSNYAGRLVYDTELSADPK